MTEETELTPNTIYRARPIIEINGQQNEMVQTLLLSMEMNENENGLSSAELCFSNTSDVANNGIDLAFEYSDEDALSLGNTVKIQTGDENDPREIFNGIISGLELSMENGKQPELSVFAEDSLQKARMSRHTRVHNGRLSEIIESIASELGLRSDVNGLDMDVGKKMQLNESNLAFIRRLLNRYQADLQIIGNELHAAPKPDIRRETFTLEMGSQLKRIRATADLAHQVSSITYSGWNATSGQAIQVTNEQNIDVGPGNGRTGSQILDRSSIERNEHIGELAAADDAEGQALVNTHFAERSRQFVCVDATSEGNPGIRVGTHVTLSGIGPRFENTYYVTQACHRYDLSEGYQTDFKAECSYFGGQ